jgi:hypothetical protein
VNGEANSFTPLLPRWNAVQHRQERPNLLEHHGDAGEPAGEPFPGLAIVCVAVELPIA